MAGVGIIPDVSTLTVAFHSLLHILMKILKRILYFRSRLFDVGDPPKV